MIKGLLKILVNNTVYYGKKCGNNSVRASEIAIEVGTATGTGNPKRILSTLYFN